MSESIKSYALFQEQTDPLLFNLKTQKKKI